MEKENFIQQILDQSPTNTSKEDVVKLIDEYGEDSVEILVKLWKLETVTNSDIDADKSKWEAIRDICSSYETKMNDMMQNMQKDNA